MDRWTPALLQLGLKGIIGKGGRGPAVREALQTNVAVYLAALGGGGALAARRVRDFEVLAYEDLGTEALGRIVLDDFPAWVVNDSQGGDFYAESVKPWRRLTLDLDA
jgi:fumarate hydratase subunit beta